jgi:hypothetical protein
MTVTNIRRNLHCHLANKAAKWVKAIYNTRKSWFCKGLAAKLWEPVALKLHHLWKSKEGWDIRERERKWKKVHVKEEDKQRKAWKWRI